MADQQPGEQRGRSPLDGKDWLGAAGSVLAIALSVLGMNLEPAFRTAAVVLMLLAAGTGVAAIVLPRHRRITTTAAVVLVVAAVGILAFAPTPRPQPEPSPTPGPQLALSQVVVVPPDGAGSVATLDVTVRNDGDRVGVLTAVELSVDDFAYLPPCLYGSDLEVTGEYEAVLPDDPAGGDVVRVTLHQQIEPGAVDRFTIGLKAPQREGLGVLASYVYLLRVSVLQDRAGPAVAAGPVLVDAGSALDSDGTFYFGAPRDATAADAGSGGLCGGETDCVRQQVACWNANRAALLPLLAVPATRSPGGDAAAADLGAG